VNNYTTITFMKIKKSTIGMVVVAFTSLILITGSPFQISSSLVENYGHLYIKNVGQEAYAEDDGGGDDGGGDDGGGSDDSDDSGDSVDGGDESDDVGEEEDSSNEESEDSSEENEQSSEDKVYEDTESEKAENNNEDTTNYLDEENVDSSYENEVTETEKEDVQPYDDENDGWYGGPKDSEGHLLDKEDWPTDSEYDNEDERGQLPVSEKGFREYLKDKDISLDEDYSSLPKEKQEQLIDDYKKKQIEDDITDLEDDLCDDEDAKTTKIDKCKSDGNKKKKHDDHKTVVKKYFRDNDDNDDDVKDLAAYNMGYRNGKVDKINKMPFNDEFPFDDKDGKTWYQVGYRSGWDSGK
jgi:hypothetical protein